MCAWVSTAQTEKTVFHTHLRGQPFTQFLLGNYSFDLMVSLFLPLTLSKLFPSAQFFSLKSCPPFNILWEMENCIQFVTPTETFEISLGQMSYVYMCLLGLNIQCVRARVCIHSSNCIKGTIFLPTLIYTVIRNIFPCRDRVSSSLITTLWQENQEMSSPFSSHHSKLH